MGVRVGQVAGTDGLRARRCSWPPLRPIRVCCEHVSVGVTCPPRSQRVRVMGGAGCGSSAWASTGNFCALAVCEDGRVRSAGRIPTSVEALQTLGASLDSDDVVVLEATTGAGGIVDLLREHVSNVLVANARRLPQISRGKAKTEPSRREDAHTARSDRPVGRDLGAGREHAGALRRVCAGA